jgi:quercetin dioxygenase-like cupin family protein
MAIHEEVRWELRPGGARTFTGSALSALLASAEQQEPVKLYYVRFAPGGRTNWHAHAGTQILLVTSGICRYQREGEPVREIGAGGSVRFEEGVRHWHGASPQAEAEHFAINLGVRETIWMEEVAEGEYGG